MPRTARPHPPSTRSLPAPTIGQPEHRQRSEGQEKSVYVMARILDYDAEFYDEGLAWIATQLPGSQIVPARDLWHSSAHWLTGWRAFATTVDLGVVVTGLDGIVGRGVWTEVLDLTALSVPILWLLIDEHQIQAFWTPRLELLGGDNWTIWARMLPAHDVPEECGL